MMRRRGQIRIKRQDAPVLNVATESLRSGRSGNPDANTGKCILETHLADRTRVPDYRYALQVVLDHDLYRRGDRIVKAHGRFQGEFPGKGKQNLSDTVQCSCVHRRLLS